MPRPQASRQIVPPDDILSETSILEKSFNITELAKSIPDNESAIRWCARHNLISNTFHCRICNEPCGFIKRQDTSDKRNWNCKRCSRKYSIRTSSFFERSNLTFYQILLIIYGFAINMTQRDIVREAGVSTTTLIDWISFCTEACEDWLRNNPTEIGSMYENDSYLNEFVWRNSIKDKTKLFNHFLILIGEIYRI
ncbi:Uncharacterised protein r2_g2152 [Pycnogonum litorale]